MTLVKHTKTVQLLQPERTQTWLYHYLPSTYAEVWNGGTGYNVMYSQSNPLWRYVQEGNLKLLRLNIGGNFSSTQQTYRGNVFHADLDIGTYEVRSPVVAFNARFDSKAFPKPLAKSDTELFVLGGTAIARCLPTNPVADLAQFMGEIKADGLPIIPGREWFKETTRRSGHPFGATGGEYLNYTFGWKPVVSDLKKFARAATTSDSVVRQYVRNSGRLIRRRYSFPSVTTRSETVASAQAGHPRFATQFYARYGTLRTITTETRKTWLSAAFTYHLALGSNTLDRMMLMQQKANRLFGMRITPYTVWELTPWSWALDWFGNFGDVAKTVSASLSDGLVLHHAYIMEEVTSTVRYELEGLWYNSQVNTYGGTQAVPPLFQEFTTTVKNRRAATPFGFGLNPALFTSRQWAIIAALGISKMPRAL